MANPTVNSSARRSVSIAARVNHEAQRLATRLDSRYEKSPVVLSGVSAGRNQVQIGGQLYPAEGIEGQGGAVAVVNVGSPAVAKYAPPSNRSVVALAGTGRGGGPGGGSPGPVYLAGEAINIDGSYEISVKRDAAGAIGIGGGGGLKVNVGNGIAINTNAIAVDLATNPGLEFSAGQVRVKIYDGIQRDSNGIGVRLNSPSGLAVSGSGLAIGAGNGINVLTNSIAVKLETHSGLTFGGSLGLAMGTPTTLTYASTSHVTSTTHAHAITATHDVGSAGGSESLLKSNSSGQLVLTQATLYGNLVFAGGDRNINASNNLTISPTTDLILDPTGLIVLPNAQEMRTGTFQDLPTGITGFRMWDRGSNYRQITTGAGKFDELYVRVFVADEVRIDRGEEYWSKSYGVVEEDFVMPADEATVDVWFENSPAMAAANLFSVGDWLLSRTIDWDTSLTIEKIWFQAVSLLTAGSVDGYRQQWRIRRKFGGTTSSVVKKGNVFLDSGQVGQGWIHLSALEQDGGPFIQMGEMTSISSDTPQHTNYVRLGNLNGTVDYSVDTWGIAAGTDGSDGIASTPSTGFSGFAIDGDNGARFFNTSILLYAGSTLVTSMNNSNGLRFLQDSAKDANDERYIEWHSNINPVGGTTRRGVVSSYLAGGASWMEVSAYNTSTNVATLFLGVINTSGEKGLLITSSDASMNFSGTYVRLGGSTLVGVDATSGLSPTSKLHVYENTSSTGSGVGITIEQAGSGDAKLSFVIPAITYSIGIDNSESDSFKITRAATLGTVADLFATNSSLTIVRAGGSSGLHLQDDAGNTGVFVADLATRIGLGTSNLKAIASGMVGVQVGDGGYFLAQNNTANINMAANAYYDGAWKRMFSGLPALLELHTGALQFVTAATGSADSAISWISAFRVMPTGYVGIGTSTPGVDVIGSTDYQPGNLVHLDSASTAAMLVRGAGPVSLDLIYTGASSNQKWFRMYKSGSNTLLTHVSDTNGGNVGGNLVIGSGSTEGVGISGLPESGTAVITYAGGSMRGHVVEVHGTAQFHFLGRRSTGTYAVPSLVTNGSVIMALGGLGYTSGGWATNQSAEISFRATEDYNTGTSGKGGAEISIRTRANGAGSTSERILVGQDGSVSIPYVWATAVAGTAVHVNSNGILTKNTSSIRHKTNVRVLPDGYGDDFVMAMRPVMYNATNGPDSSDQIGFIAEQIQAIGGGLGEPFISRNDAGLVESLHYDRLIAPTVAAVQRLIARNAHLEARVADLERRLN